MLKNGWYYNQPFCSLSLTSWYTYAHQVWSETQCFTARFCKSAWHTMILQMLYAAVWSLVETDWCSPYPFSMRQFSAEVLYSYSASHWKVGSVAIITKNAFNCFVVWASPHDILMLIRCGQKLNVLQPDFVNWHDTRRSCKRYMQAVWRLVETSWCSPYRFQCASSQLRSFPATVLLIEGWGRWP